MLKDRSLIVWFSMHTHLEDLGPCCSQAVPLSKLVLSHQPGSLGERITDRPIESVGTRRLMKNEGNFRWLDRI
jgi:hypothetical protein